jgi:hypothetical protein
MFIFTKYTAYNGLVGISEDGEVYDMKTNRKMKKEVHCGAIYFRSISSSKIEKTKIESRQQIKSIIFKQ